MKIPSQIQNAYFSKSFQIATNQIESNKIAQLLGLCDDQKDGLLQRSWIVIPV